MAAVATASLSAVSLPLTAVFLGTGCVAVMFTLYLLVLSIAALFYRGAGARLGTSPASRVLVVVPAHNESELIGRCVRALRAQRYPTALFRIVVVADNCTDETATVARSAGADLVLARDEPDAHGKGRALRWAMDRLLPDLSTDAVVIVDADSTVGPQFLPTLVQHYEAGAQVVQADNRLCGDGSARSALRVAAFLLVNRVRLAGRAALGLSAPGLGGNGMLLAREILLEHPWAAFTSTEDVEYSIDLRIRGVKIVFAGGAVVEAPTAPSARAAAQQQLRWEGGKAYLARTRIPRLIKAAIPERNLTMLDVAFNLAIPPLGFLAASILAGILVSASLNLLGLLPRWVLTPWLLAAVSLPLSVLVGLRAGGASSTEYRALLHAPLFVLAKPLHLRQVLRFRPDTWVRTERAPGKAPVTRD